MLAARILVTVAAVCTGPSLVIVLRQNLWECLQPHRESFDDATGTACWLDRPWLLKFLGTALLLAAATVVAICVPGLDVAFGLTGSLTASLIIYIIPGATYLHLDPQDESLGVSGTSRALAWLCVVWGVLMGSVCSVYIVAASIG